MLLKTLNLSFNWVEDIVEKEKMLVTMIFSLSHNSFNPFLNDKF